LFLSVGVGSIIFAPFLLSWITARPFSYVVQYFCWVVCILPKLCIPSVTWTFWSACIYSCTLISWCISTTLLCDYPLFCWVIKMSKKKVKLWQTF
jgi:hypothetical protein